MTSDMSAIDTTEPKARAPQRETASNVISISSGKGGVGKTWFAVTLCHALAASGHRVLLLDGDLGLANVDVQIGLAPRYDLGNVLAGDRTLEGAITPFEAGGFDIVAGQSGSGGLATLPLPRLHRLRDAVFTLGRKYDHAVIDIGAGIDRTVQTLASGTGTSLVMTTDEPTSLTDAYAFVKVMAAAGAADNIGIVVNMASSRRQGEHTYRTLLRACEEFLKLSPPLIGIIRRDPHVADTIRHQGLMLIRYSGSDAAADVEAIATNIGHL